MALVLVAALGLRIGIVTATHLRPANDARFYLALADDITHHGDYAHAGRAAGGAHGPTAYFPPGYPYLLAAADLLDGHSLTGARIAQALVGTGVVALTGAIAFEALGEAAAGLIALVLAAVYPALVELSTVLVAETLFTLLVLGATYAGLRVARTTHKRRTLLAAGVLSGLATLTHENGIVLVIPLSVVAIRAIPTQKLTAVALVLAGAALAIAPWTVRNALVLHSFVPVSDETGITLAGTYNAVSARSVKIPWAWRVNIAVRRPRRLAEPQLDHRELSAALTYIGGNPGAPLSVAWHNALRMLELEGSHAWTVSGNAIGLSTRATGVGVVGFWILAALALAGAFARNARAVPRWVWLVPLLLALSIVLVNVETPRFREPIDPFLIVLAAGGLAALAQRRRGRAANRCVASIR